MGGVAIGTFLCGGMGMTAFLIPRKGIGVARCAELFVRCLKEAVYI